MKIFFRYNNNVGTSFNNNVAPIYNNNVGISFGSNVAPSNYGGYDQWGRYGDYRGHQQYDLWGAGFSCC